MRYVVREKIRIFYEAYRLTTGLTDCLINIYKENGTKIVNSQVMTELDNLGLYYYDFTPADTGTFLVYCNSESQTRYHFEKLVIFKRTERYGQEMRGGGSASFKLTPSWSPEEKDKIFSVLNFISEKHDKHLEKLEEKINKNPIDIESLKEPIHSLYNYLTEFLSNKFKEIEEHKEYNKNLIQELLKQLQKEIRKYLDLRDTLNQTSVMLVKKLDLQHSNITNLKSSSSEKEQKILSLIREENKNLISDFKNELNNLKNNIEESSEIVKKEYKLILRTIPTKIMEDMIHE